MKTLSRESFQNIKTWMHRNAREVDLAAWRCHFENGSKDDVLSALTYYQNADGGFGRALEADSWNPDSSPYTTLYAINMLNGIGFTDMRHPTLQGIVRFLGSGAHCSEIGWHFNIPTNNDHPHAPWWAFRGEPDARESIGVTAELAAFVLTRCDNNSGVYDKALGFGDMLIAKLGAPGGYGDMGVGGYCKLLEGIRAAGLEGRFDAGSIEEKLRKLVNASIVRDTSKWAGYSVRPSDYITSPESIFYKGNEEIVSAELDYLVETRPAGGVWDITWSWFENTEKYPQEFAVSRNWWRACKAIEKMNFLNRFGRVE